MSKPASPNSTSMSATDAAFLYIERKEIPLHIASVCIFDGPIPFPEFVALVSSKLHLLPRYRQIPVFPALTLGFPTWQDDPNFDIHHHVFRATLESPGGDAELQTFVGNIFSQLLPRDRPLWDLHVLDGLKDGRGALIWRVHHSLADGVSGVELIKTLLDPTPDYSTSVPKPRFRRTRTQQPKEQSLGETISGVINTTMASLLQFESSVLQFAQTIVRDTNQDTLSGLLKLLPEFTSSIERLPFNKPCTGSRKFCWLQLDMADIQAVREIGGGTVNDVILTVLTRALARYVKMHGQSVVNRFIRIVCPVNLRVAEQSGTVGNQISFLPVALPMDAAGPMRMLHAVTTRTENLKRCGALGFAALAAKWLTSAPPPLQAIFWRSIPEIILPVPALNMICTNVAGSPTPLYAVGRRMLAVYPQVPTGYDLGVGCAAYSYDGKLFFGLIADTHAAPDVERLRDFMLRSFQELRRAAAMKKTRTVQRTARAVRKPVEPEIESVPVSAPQYSEEKTPPGAAASIEQHSKEAA
jgi:diacylglycerol O-acyltransferase / wax synthase